MFSFQAFALSVLLFISQHKAATASPTTNTTTTNATKHNVTLNSTTPSPIYIFDDTRGLDGFDDLMMTAPNSNRSVADAIDDAAQLAAGTKETFYGSITGFGYNYYFVMLENTTDMILDFVVRLDKKSSPDNCKGFVVSVDVMDTPPPISDRVLAAGEQTFFQSLMETMVLMTQESILCQSCARVGVSTKHTYGHNKYWLLVQTRSTSAMVESNVTCRYLINVNVIESKPFVMGMAVVLAVCGVMILGTTLSYLSFILSPRFTVFPWTGSFAFVFMLLPNELLVLFMWIGQQAWRGASWMYEKLKAVLPDRHQQHHRTDGTSERALITPHRNHVEVNIVDDVEMAPLSASVTDNAVVSIGGGGEEGRTATTSIHSTPQQQDITPPPSAPSITEGTTNQNNHEEDEDDVIACRICRDDTNAEELIQPCRCTGSMAYVHRSCLDKWRSQCLARNSINSSRCEVCHSPFMLSIQYNMMDVAIRMASNKFPKVVKKVALGLLMWAVVVLFGCMCDAVLGFITCNAEWHEVVTPNHENIVQVHVVGFFYYSFFSWVMYNAAYFAWLLAVNTNLHGEVPELLTLGRQIFRTVSFALISAVWGSYLLKFVLFMVSELVVWDWELGLTTGTFVMLMIVGLLGTIMQSRELFLRRLRRFLWHRRGRRQLRRGARVDVLEDGEEDPEHGENHEEGHNDDVEEENHNEEVAMHPVHDQPTEETIHS